MPLSDRKIEANDSQNLETLKAQRLLREIAQTRLKSLLLKTKDAQGNEGPEVSAMAFLNKDGIDNNNIVPLEKLGDYIELIKEHSYFQRLEGIMQVFPRISLGEFLTGVISPQARKAEQILENKSAKPWEKKWARDEIKKSQKRPAEHNNRKFHSIEVSKVTAEIATRLGLDEPNIKIAEMSGLLHDLGHMGFGHEGEDALKSALKKHELPQDMVDHNRNGLKKIAEIGVPAIVALMVIYHDGLALNDEKVKKKFDISNLPAGINQIKLDLNAWPPLEAQIAGIADDVANATRDLKAILKADNAEGPGLTLSEMRKKSKLIDQIALEMEQEKRYKGKHPDKEKQLGNIINRIKNNFISDVVDTTLKNIGDEAIHPVSLSKDLKDELINLKDIIKEEREKFTERHKLGNMVIELFDIGMSNDYRKLPPQFSAAINESQNQNITFEELKQRKAEAIVEILTSMKDVELFDAYKYTRGTEHTKRITGNGRNGHHGFGIGSIS